MTPVIIAFFLPALWVFILVLLFVIVDTITGRKRAKFVGEKITSNRFSDIFAKTIGYAVFLCFGLVINKITGWEYGVWLSAIIPIYTEVLSIDENQRAVNKKGILKQAEDVYQFALKIKKKKDQLRN
jgi:uncharacterized membrane protein